jgi:hypothetical protein
MRRHGAIRLEGLPKRKANFIEPMDCAPVTKLADGSKRLMPNCSGILRIIACRLFLGYCATLPARAEHSALLTPTGSYSVGRTFFYWTDPNRTDPVAAQTGTKREFMVIAWYPAEANASDAHALWMPERWALSEAKLLYAERSNSPNPLTMGEALRAVHESVSSSIAEAPSARTKSLWPLLLFAPGAGVNPAFRVPDTMDYAMFRRPAILAFVAALAMSTVKWPQRLARGRAKNRRRMQRRPKRTRGHHQDHLRPRHTASNGQRCNRKFGRWTADKRLSGLR